MFFYVASCLKIIQIIKYHKTDTTDKELYGFVCMGACRQACKPETVVEQLISNVGRFKLTFAERDKKQTKTDLREESRQTGFKTSFVPR
jgi:hypothetical protein